LYKNNLCGFDFSSFEAIGVHSAIGVLLHGPPGCGKTLVAKAIANESAANFISIKGPELLNKYVGESERAVRTVFYRGRAASPCVLFIDEIDAIASKRVGGENSTTERLVNQLLTEMDGIESRRGVYVIAATNRPDILDPALLRPGRFDKIILIPIPSSKGRVSILRKSARKARIAPEADLTKMAIKSRMEGFTGADLKAIVNDACLLSIKNSLSDKMINSRINNFPMTPVVQFWHFESTLKIFVPLKCRSNNLY